MSGEPSEAAWWVDWFLKQSRVDQETTARAVIDNSRVAWECRSQAHRRYLRECRERHT